MDDYNKYLGDLGKYSTCPYFVKKAESAADLGNDFLNLKDNYKDECKEIHLKYMEDSLYFDVVLKNKISLNRFYNIVYDIEHFTEDKNVTITHCGNYCSDNSMFILNHIAGYVEL